MFEISADVMPKSTNGAGTGATRRVPLKKPRAIIEIITKD